MFRSYLQTAVRSIMRNRWTSLLTVIGLSLGMTTAILLFLHVHFEWSFDRFHHDASRIHRVIARTTSTKGVQEQSTELPADLAESITGQTPDIEAIVRTSDGPGRIRFGDQVFRAEVLYADPNFFDVFAFRLQEGDAHQALHELNNIVVSRSFAIKHFPAEQATGKTLLFKFMDEYLPFTISGVMEDMPENTRFNADILLPFAWEQKRIETLYTGDWSSSYCHTYLKLREGASAEAIESFFDRTITPLDSYNEPSGVQRRYLLQPLQDTHLAFRNPRGLPVELSSAQPLILALIGFTVLLLAAINFTTIAMSRIFTRAREIGVRKVMGARRSQIIIQHFFETTVIVLISLLIAIVLSELLAPHLTTLLGHTVQLDFSAPVFFALGGITLLTALLAGVYPAFLISSLPPVESLRQLSGVGGRQRIRKTLQLVQFVAAITLLSLSLIIGRQLRFIQTMSTGVNTEHLVAVQVVNQDETVTQLLKRLRYELQTVPEVKGITGANSSFGYEWTKYKWTYYYQAYNEVYNNIVDESYLDVMGLELLQGRNFSKDFGKDYEHSVIINESMAKMLGMEDAAGRPFPGSSDKYTTSDYIIIGVVKDFQYASAREQIRPLILSESRFAPPAHSSTCMSHSFSSLQWIFFRLDGQNLHETMNRIGHIWTNVADGIPFQYEFVDDTIERQYKTEQNTRFLMNAGTCLAIIISLFGLIGLSVFDLQQKTKEVGIRKVLGASTTSVLHLFARDFLRWILLANIIALPLATFLAHRWLQQFAFRIATGFTTQLFAGIAFLLAGLITILIITFRLARQNLVQSIRYE